MEELFIITRNRYKKLEFQHLFKKYLPGTKIKFESLKFKEICSLSQIANLKEKISSAYQKFKRPVLVDDTSIFINRYHDFPGTHNKWLIDSIGTDGLLRLIDDGDRASFQCFLGFYDGKAPIIFRGEINGIIKLNRKPLTKGLEYSAIFVPMGMKKPMANFYKSGEFFDSHRARAFKKLYLFLIKKYKV